MYNSITICAESKETKLTLLEICLTISGISKINKVIGVGVMSAFLK